MVRPSPSHFEAAQHLFALARAKAHDSGADVARLAYEMLEDAFGPILGGGSIRALLLRSMRVNVAEFAFLDSVLRSALDAPDERSLGEHVSDCLRAQGPPEDSRAAAALYAGLFALLDRLIGESLVSQILARAYPAPVDTVSEEEQ